MNSHVGAGCWNLITESQPLTVDGGDAETLDVGPVLRGWDENMDKECPNGYNVTSAGLQMAKARREGEAYASALSSQLEGPTGM